MGEFLTKYDAADSPAAQAALLKEWLDERSKPLFAELRAERPILVGPAGLSIVTRHADCVEVLSRATAFTVAPYGAKLAAVASPMMLGEDGTAAYQRDHGAMSLVMRRDDLPALRARVAEAAESALAGCAGEIDIVARLAGPVTAGVMIDYLGLGADPAAVRSWAREMFRGVFLKVFERENSDVFVAATAAFRAHVDARIAERRRGGERGAGTVLDRLLTLFAGADPVFDDATITSNLIAMTTGALEPATDAIASVLAALLARPAALDAARAAALAGDHAAVWAHCAEAARLSPPLELLVRLCVRDSVVGFSADHAATIPAGHLVMAVVAAGAADPTAMRDPDAFIADRPAETGLLFGAGPHACFGRRLGEILVAEQIAALLRRPGLRRVDGEEPVFDPEDRAFVDRYVVAV